MRPLQLLLATYPPHARQHLRRLIESEPGLRVVDHCSYGRAVVRLAQHLAPDVVLLDLDIPGGDALETLRRLNALRPRVATLVLASDVCEPAALDAVRCGASGIVPKRAPRALLSMSVRAVAAGRPWLAPEHVAVMAETLRSVAPMPSPAPQVDEVSPPGRFGLTPRELEIVAAVATGASNQEIAERLSVRPSTVKHHLSNVFDKVGVFSRVQLALFAVQHELVEFVQRMP
jgi:two-component system, NarL family, nitrate/nitrite response regulator NarL